MKFTQYFMHMRNREDRRTIRMEWIEQAVFHPVREHVQADGRIRRWARIAEAGNRYLRVVLLEDGRTVHNAFFDRSFREVTDER
ncbi:MAG: hypothetical protein GXY19_06235 [Phycisphaerae bacterium]|nr:hypothetical protein [Phycisphaerae bacterium]